MMRACRLLLLIALLPAAARADLASDIKAILRDKYLNKVELGISVARLGDATDENIYRFESDIPLIPASNLKVCTTSAFLDRVGSDFKFKTTLLARDGDIYLIGDGDPTLGDVELIKKFGWDVNTVFKTWAEEIRKRGVTSVRNVFVDDSVFDQQFTPAHWLARYANARYSAQVGGVNLNANCIDFYVRPTSPGRLVTFTMDPDTRYVSVRNQCLTGRNNAIGIVRQSITDTQLILKGECDAPLGDPVSIPINDPPLFAATVMAETFAANGLPVAGRVERDRTAREQQSREPSRWATVAALETKISTVLDRANKDSMNLYAECMCKRLGHQVSGQSGSWENGTAAVGEFLQRLGIPSNQYHLDDGSGLSRENNVSPDALLKILCYNFRSKNKQTFMDSLAVAGADGTFKKRFKNNLRGRVFGKSGYVTGVSAISGYLHARDDQWYAFSILMNNCPAGTNDKAKEIQEKIVTAVDENVR